MIPPQEHFEEDETGQYSFPEGKLIPLQQARDDTPLARRARLRAVDDMDKVRRIVGNGTPVVIQEETLSMLAETWAKEDPEISFNSASPPDVIEYKQRIIRWKRAYLEQIEEEKRTIAGLKRYPDRKAEQLASKARADRKKHTFPSSGRGPFHQRDLAVVSALHELDLCQNLEEHLPKIHDYVDIYEEAFRNVKEEVIWPNQDSFRS